MTQLLPSRAELDAHAAASPAFAAWQAGYGPFQHTDETRAAVYRMAHQLVQAGLQPSLDEVYLTLQALDRLSCAGLRLVVHMTYARRLHPDGGPLEAEDFKDEPEGHTGGALNMVPAYAGYLALNALTGQTRGWLMGQGHCVAAIEALNVLTGNLHEEQRRYAEGQAGLERLLQDFYSYEQDGAGRPAAPLGSHVNPHTAGGWPRAATSVSPSCNTRTCRCRAKRWWPSCPTAPPKSSVAATGFRAGGARRTAGSPCR